MKKTLVRVLLVLVLVLVAAIVVGALMLDRLVKHGVETFGPKFTKVDVRLESVSLSVFSGGGSIKGFVLGNPPGYKTPEAIRVGRASLSLVPSSLLSDKIVIRSIRVEGPEITFEGDFKGNNLGQINENVQAATGGGATNVPTAQADAGPGKKLQVDEFVVSGAKLTVKHALLSGPAVTVALPEIRMSGLGTGPEGITAGELTGRVLGMINVEALKAAKDAVAKAGKQVVDQATSGAKDAVDQSKQAVQGVTDLLKKKK